MRRFFGNAAGALFVLASNAYTFCAAGPELIFCSARECNDNRSVSSKKTLAVNNLHVPIQLECGSSSSADGFYIPRVKSESSIQ